MTHALGFRKDEIDRFIETTLVKIETSTMSLNDYVALTMENWKIWCSGNGIIRSS